MFNIFLTNPLVKIDIIGNNSLDEYREKYLKTKEPILVSGDVINGSYSIAPPPGKSISHQSITISLIAEIRRIDGEVITKFLDKTQTISPAGDLKYEISSKFSFGVVSFPTSSYRGSAINIIYSIQIILYRRLSDFKQEQTFIALVFHEPENPPVSIHSEVGIRNLLHLEFVFPSGFCGFSDALVGAVYFILVKIRIIHMSLAFYRVESYNSDDNFIKKKVLLKNYEILDGAVVRGDHIPIRFFVGELNIWPYIGFQKSKLVVEHYLRASLTDENGKSYFKRIKVDFQRFRPQGLVLITESTSEGQPNK